MKYLITEDQINEWIGNVLTANHKMELKPIEPLSDEDAEAVWELLVDNNTDNIVTRFNREITAHILGETT